MQLTAGEEGGTQLTAGAAGVVQLAAETASGATLTAGAAGEAQLTPEVASGVQFTAGAAGEVQLSAGAASGAQFTRDGEMEGDPPLKHLHNRYLCRIFLCFPQCCVRDILVRIRIRTYDFRIRLLSSVTLRMQNRFFFHIFFL